MKCRILPLNRTLYLLFFLVLLSSCEDKPKSFSFEIMKDVKCEACFYAVKKDNYKGVIDNCKNSDCLTFQDAEFGMSILHLAVVNNKKRAVEALIDLGADFYMQNNNGYSPLLYTCNNVSNPDCYDDLLELFLKKGANANHEIVYEQTFANSDIVKVYYTNLLIQSIESGCLNNVKLLVDYGVNVNKFRNYEGDGALQTCITLGKMKILKFLVIETNCIIPETVMVTVSGDSLSFEEYLINQDFSLEPTKDKIRKELIDYHD